MDPFTAAMIGTSLISAYGSWQAGQQQQAAYEMAAAEKERLARVIMEDFEANAETTKREGRKFMSTQQATYAASGVDISTGSPLIAMEDTMSAIDERIAMDRRKAIAQATAARAGAQVDLAQGEAAAESGKWQAFSTLAQGGARLAR